MADLTRIWKKDRGWEDFPPAEARLILMDEVESKD